MGLHNHVNLRFIQLVFLLCFWRASAVIVKTNLDDGTFDMWPSPNSGLIEEQSSTDNVLWVDLDTVHDKGNSTQLTSRTDVKWTDRCQVGFGATSLILSISANVLGWKNYINTIYDKNHTPEECQAIPWNIGGQTVIYIPSGSCNFDMKKVTLESAISQGVEALSAVSASKGCITLDHGGNWKGYLKIAAEGEDVNSVSCEGGDSEVCAKGTGGADLLK